MKVILRTRRNDLHAPIKCDTCGEEIKKGKKYWSKSACAAWHESCKEPPLTGKAKEIIYT